MKLTFHKAILATVIIAACALADGAHNLSIAGATTTPLPNGGSVVTLTTRNGSECTLFSKAGAPMCTRTYPINDHQTAIKKCVAMKC